MWHNVFENTLPALVGAGVVGLIFGLARQRSAAWILAMVIMFALIAASTQIIWELFPQLHHGWQRFAVGIGVAIVIAAPLSFLMQRFRKKDDQDA